jgi:hypothetical protein
MFMQIIQGTITDAAAARATLDRWLTDLKPGATGWLGGTYGITDDGMLVACVRFEDERAAATNALRPEQSAWWKEMERHFSGPVTFHDCSDVRLLLGGGSDEASFVQVIQGRVRDRERFLSLMDSSGEMLAHYRPDVLGATIAIDDNGVVTETVAFTSEEAARRAEHTELPADVREMVDEEMSLIEDVQFLDLHAPWFATARLA